MIAETLAGSSGHIAAFYRDDAEYLDVVGPVITEGVAKGEPVLVAVPTDKLGLLGEALGDTADQVVWSDLAEAGRNPARTFAAFETLLDQHAGRRIRMIGEPVWPGGRSAEEYGACVQNEALWNAAFADRDVLTLCPYDEARLPGWVLDDARMTHPLIWGAGGVFASEDYAHWEAFARYNEPLPTDPAAVSCSLSVIADLASARTFTAQYADSIGLIEHRVGDLQLIVSELATNSLKYTAGGCTVSLWQRDGELVCEVRDGGRFDNPMAGRRVPDVCATSGRGLFLVNALADLVRIHTSPNGTTIQAHLRLAPGRAVSR